MYAPALALDRGAAEALDTSRALSKARRNFGLALGIAVAYGLVTACALLAWVGAGHVAGPVARAAASNAVWWVGMPWVVAKVANEPLVPRADRGPPTLALASRPSRCPRCGALASVPVAGPAEVACGSCGLRATLR
jgi:hypothetical protein